VLFAQALCCDAIVNLSTDNDDVQAQMLLAGARGFRLLLRALDTHATNSEVAERVCVAVSAITGSLVNQTAAVDLGLIPRIVKVLAIHGPVSSLQAAACTTLWNVSLAAMCARAIFNARGSQWLLRAMDLHMHDVAVQIAAVGAVSNLAAEPHTQVRAHCRLC
jgi:hypothetical protein